METHKASLLILAAGMGSRYGALKQMDAFGPNGETIIDYSIYDAIQAGFTKIVFVIRSSFQDEFKERMEQRWLGKIEMNYVCQELDNIPEPFQVPVDRAKPWGTGHAVWVAKDLIDEPFGVINADDYYGREALKSLYDFLISSSANESIYVVIAYLLKNTLSDFGKVNRGVCTVDEDGFLKFIKECKGISINVQNEIFYSEYDKVIQLSPDTPVSMNMWGFHPNYFEWAEDYFIKFLSDRIFEENAEFYIPELIQELMDRGELKVGVLKSPSKWFGVTYQEDKPMVQEAFRQMIASNYYPEQLN